MIKKLLLTNWLWVHGNFMCMAQTIDNMYGRFCKSYKDIVEKKVNLKNRHDGHWTVTYICEQYINNKCSYKVFEVM